MSHNEVLSILSIIENIDTEYRDESMNPATDSPIFNVVKDLSKLIASNLLKIHDQDVLSQESLAKSIETIGNISYNASMTIANIILNH